MEPDTGGLVENATRGDRDAIDRLLARFLPDLARYVDRHAGGLVAEKESSSDLVQSVCRELLERLEDRRFRYRGEAEFRKWLYGAALMKISNRARFWRAAKRDAAREGGSSISAHAFEAQATPSRHFELSEELDRLRLALERLPESYREVIELAQVEGLTHEEIAGKLGITEGHSRVLLSRALARLSTLGM